MSVQTPSDAREELFEKWSQQVPSVARMVLPVIAFFLGLHVISLFVPDYVVPPLPSIAQDYVSLWVGETGNAVATFGRIVAGILLGLVFGGGLGIVMGLNQTVREWTETFIKFLTGIPGLSWVLLAVLWFDNIRVRLLFVLFVVVFPFYALNISDAIKGIPRDYRNMVKSFRFSYPAYVRRLVIPFLIPNLVAVSKTVIGYTTRVVIVAELVGASVGIGQALLVARSNFDVSEIFAWTFILVTIMLSLQGVLVIIENTLLSWQEAEAGGE